MKKKVVSVLVASALAVSCAPAAFAGETEASTEASVSFEIPSSADFEDAYDESFDYGSGDIKIWVAENVVDFTKQVAEEYIASHSALSGYTVTVEPVGEGDAATNMITDVEAGADIYGFAQDQLARLVAAGALEEVAPDNVDAIKEANDEGSVAAATVGDTLYAYPETSDNGYFLYYDKSVVTDPTSLEKIVEDCEKAGKSFYMEINSGWYQPAFFFGAGCTLKYDTDTDGNFTTATVDYANEKGVAAMKAMIKLHQSAAFQNGSSASDATNYAAIVDGTWDAATVQEAFGDNYACAKLPSYTTEDGTAVQLGGFSGYKLMGEKPQEDEAKLAACDLLINYLTSEPVQLARYNAVQWGPSNKNAQADDAVKSNAALAALNEQMAFDIPQGQYPGDYWSLATGLGDSIIGGDYDNASDDDLMAALTDFQTTCQGYAAGVAETEAE